MDQSFPSREEIQNRIFDHLRARVAFIKANPNLLQQFQISEFYSLFPVVNPSWQQHQFDGVVREVIQQLEHAGYIYEGHAGGVGNQCTYPWYSISEMGQSGIMKEDWVPYDPEGYMGAFQKKIPTVDQITLAYVGEAVSAYNRRNLLSATLTIGVASENLMLSLIEAYTTWMHDSTRRLKFQKKIEGRFISAQYKEFKKEFLLDIKIIPSKFQGDWETYLDGVFNFIRLNRNDAGHPTGKKFDAKMLYASLQIFLDYGKYIFELVEYFQSDLAKIEKVVAHAD